MQRGGVESRSMRLKILNRDAMILPVLDSFPSFSHPPLALRTTLGLDCLETQILTFMLKPSLLSQTSSNKYRSLANFHILE